jgi:hypothetical protein
VIRRSARLLAAVLGVAGCAHVGLAPQPSPPSGPAWAFFTDRDLTLGPNALVYTRSLVACEQERLRRFETNRCVQVTVGPGTDYYALGLPTELDTSLPDGAIGAVTRERCEQFRALHMIQYSRVGDCEPIGVKTTP